MCVVRLAIPARSAANAQPAPVVRMPRQLDRDTAICEFPESARDIVENAQILQKNACRAAMLQASPVLHLPPAAMVLCAAGCPVHILATSGAQSDCCPAQSNVNPAQAATIW
ncbi:hypothetical protein RBI21_06875 [Klebsiella pneumoniae]|nr:hypothetical protein RBI21_06875 [Klebsiella pneumoniae]